MRRRRKRRRLQVRKVLMAWCFRCFGQGVMQQPSLAATIACPQYAICAKELK